MNDSEFRGDYLPKVINKLKDCGFSIGANVNFKNYRFDVVARRKKFHVETFGIANVVFIFSKFQHSDINSLRNYSRTCFNYALQKRGFHLPRGFGYSVFCFPVAIVNSLNQDTANMIQRKAPPAHWSASEMLVVFSLNDNKLFYCEITPEWGRWYYDAERRGIRSLLTPSSGLTEKSETDSRLIEPPGNQGALRDTTHFGKTILKATYALVLFLCILAIAKAFFSNNAPQLPLSDSQITGLTLLVISILLNVAGYFFPKIARFDKNKNEHYIFISQFIFRIPLFVAPLIFGYTLVLMGASWYFTFVILLLTTITLFLTFPTDKRWGKWINTG